MTDTPDTLTYVAVVSSYLIPIVLTISALNGLDILPYDIQSACLNDDF